MKVINYPVEVLRPFIEELFSAAGVSKKDSFIVTDAFIEANLRGVDTHGLRLAPAYIKRLENGGVNPQPQIKIISDSGAAVRIDGDDGLGQIVGSFAMKTAVKKAKEHGVGFATAGQTSHIGAASYYTRLALEKNMAGFATSNNLPSLFVWGGLKRALSNPPFSISFPTKKTPFVLDICLGTVAWNKIYMMLNEGKSIPPGWAWDAKGRVTTDPKAASDGGSVIPIGGHKGSSLTVAVEFFTGVLSGSKFGPQVKALLTNESEPEESSCLMMAFDVTRILGPDILERAEEFISWCKDSPLAEGFNEILMPGEPEEKIRSERLKSGIPLLEQDIKVFKGLAQKKKIASPF